MDHNFWYFNKPQTTPIVPLKEVLFILNKIGHDLALFYDTQMFPDMAHLRREVVQPLPQTLMQKSTLSTLPSTLGRRR